MTTKVYEQAFSESAEGLDAYNDLVAVVRQLRRDCPWDREQTHESVKHLFVEETYEAVEAIESGDDGELKKELGDVLLHVLFHSVIAEEGGRFSPVDVARSITEKLIRRHPHVFGETEVENVDEVLTNWEKIKLKEDGSRTVLDGVPGSLPALLRAYRIQEKAAGVGFDFPDSASAWQKVVEEIEEYGKAVRAPASTSDAMEEEFGDVLFALVNHARLSGINGENALRRTIDKFLKRFSYIEKSLADRGSSVVDSDLDEMDALWEEAKTLER